MAETGERQTPAILAADSCTRQPNQVHSPTTMLACVDGMSEECQKILEDVNSKSGACALTLLGGVYELNGGVQM